MKDVYKGLTYGAVSLILVELQPILANSRPASLDAFIFTAITCLYQSLIFLPIVIQERYRVKSKFREELITFQEMASTLHGWKKNYKFLLFIGVIFSVSQVLFFIGYEIAGAINGSLALKSTIVFGLIFGYVINRERISIIQIIFSFLLFFGLMIATTQGSFNVLEFNLGVIFLIITALLWILSHALTKPLLEKRELTSANIVFIRNGLNFIILFSLYITFYFINNQNNLVDLLFNPLNQLYYILFALAYAFDLYSWYKMIQYIEVSKSIAFMGPTPLVTAILASFLLAEVFTFYHAVGMGIIVISIFIIINVKQKSKEPIAIHEEK